MNLWRPGSLNRSNWKNTNWRNSGNEDRGNQAEATEVNLAKRTQVMEQRISGFEDMIGEMNISGKENVKSKNFLEHKSGKSVILWKDQTLE